MAAGIVLFAFAMKTTLAHVGDELDTIPALGLCGGPALYLLAYVALRLRVSRTLGRGRLVAAVACGLLFPVAVVAPELVTLALVAAVCHYRLDAVRAHLLEMAGDTQAALVHYRAAANRTTSLPEQPYLTKQAARLRDDRWHGGSEERPR